MYYFLSFFVDLDSKSCNVSAPETNRTVIPPKRDFMSSNNAHKHHSPSQMHHYQQNKSTQPNPPGLLFFLNAFIFLIHTELTELLSLNKMHSTI